MIYYRFIAEALFFLFIALIFFGGILTVRARLLMHSVLGLAVTMVGIAGLYFYLGSMFMTLMQVLIYVGAICVVLVFGIMVGYTPTEVMERKITGKNTCLAVTACTSLFSLLAYVISKTLWTPALERTGDMSLGWLGEQLIYKYCLSFELISVVLLIAIVGSIILAEGGRETDREKEQYQQENAEVNKEVGP